MDSIYHLTAAPEIVISFMLHGETISGTLTGSTHWWVFKSSSPAFIRNFPWGWLRTSQYLVQPPTLDMSIIMQRVSEQTKRLLRANVE